MAIVEDPLRAAKIDGQAFLFASGNKGKLAEVRSVAGRFALKVASPGELASTGYAEFGLPAPLIPLGEVDEPAETYHENAAIKAKAYFDWSSLPSVADDTGLEVRALGGNPGVRSARYAGEPSNPERNIAKVLRELRDAKDRSARFVCCLCACISSGIFIEVKAELPGAIIDAPRGAGGFGYDGIFVPDGYTATLAELKDPRSSAYAPDLRTHRILALEELLPKLRQSLIAGAPRRGQ